MKKYEKPHPYNKGARSVLAMRPGGGASVVVPKQVMAVAAQDSVLHPPRILPAGCSVPEGETVVIENSPNNPGCAIFFTTDGSEPSIHSPVYEGPFMIHPPPEPQVAIRAVSAAALTRFSPVATEVYRFQRPPGLITPDPVWVVAGPSVSIEHHPAATCYFSLRPEVDPLEGGYLYTGPFRLFSEEGAVYEMTAVAVMPSRAPSNAVATSVVVPAAGAPRPAGPPAPLTEHATTSPKAAQLRSAGTDVPSPHAVSSSAPRIDVRYTPSPPAITVCPLHPGSDGPAMFYSVDGQPFRAFPSSDQLVIPLDDADHLYAFIASREKGVDPAKLDMRYHPISYLFVPRRPQFECATDIGYILEQAIKWLWEVVSRIQVVNDQWTHLGYARGKRELTHCAGKMESAILLALFHLKSGSVVYEGLEVVVQPGDKLLPKHFTESNDAVMSLYHAILEVQRGASDDHLQQLLERLKVAMHRIRLLLALLPEEPPPAEGLRAPQWLEAARVRGAEVPDGADVEVLVAGGRGAAQCCLNHNDELPAHGTEMHRLLEALAQRLEAEHADKVKLQAELHQAKIDADELRNNVDTQLAWIQAARLREARMEATIDEMRRCHGHAAPAPAVHPVPLPREGQDSHLAFLISPD